MPTPLRILVITAHPDDCELKAGGVTALYRSAGHRVKYVSVTNGESGHHRHLPGQLAAIRRAECDAVAELMGLEYDVLDNRDGRLQPTLEARFQIIALIRRYQGMAGDSHLFHGPCQTARWYRGRRRRGR